MRLSYRVFCLPKSGSSSEEYEDAFAPQDSLELEAKEFRCAIADGATETSFSGLWARILCEAYIAKNFDLNKLQEEWHASVDKKELPWYAEQKLESGAFSSILGLKLKEEKKSISWSARAIGDSCFMHFREGRLLTSLPLENWQDFDYTPLLLSTRPESNQGVIEKQVEKTGSCRSGDIIYLMTDAISKWFLRRNTELGDALAITEQISTQEEFVQLVASQRAARDSGGHPMMPNDDVTWTRIHLS